MATDCQTRVAYECISFMLRLCTFILAHLICYCHLCIDE